MTVFCPIFLQGWRSGERRASPGLALTAPSMPHAGPEELPPPPRCSWEKGWVPRQEGDSLSMRSAGHTSGPGVSVLQVKVWK